MVFWYRLVVAASLLYICVKVSEGASVQHAVDKKLIEAKELYKNLERDVCSKYLDSQRGD
jgi:hypothetical protein